MPLHTMVLVAIAELFCRLFQRRRAYGCNLCGAFYASRYARNCHSCRRPPQKASIAQETGHGRA
jgi:lipopolysaccharide biosynthesis regulator YciM